MRESLKFRGLKLKEERSCGIRGSAFLCLVPLRRRRVGDVSEPLSGACIFGDCPRVSAMPAPAVILCCAPPEHRLEDAATQLRIPNDCRFADSIIGLRAITPRDTKTL